jgi:hypothetical protein
MVSAGERAGGKPHAATTQGTCAAHNHCLLRLAQALHRSLATEDVEMNTAHEAVVLHRNTAAPLWHTCHALLLSPPAPALAAAGTWCTSYHPVLQLHGCMVAGMISNQPPGPESWGCATAHCCWAVSTPPAIICCPLPHSGAPPQETGPGPAAGPLLSAGRTLCPLQSGQSGPSLARPLTWCRSGA